MADDLQHCGPPVTEKRRRGDAARQATAQAAVERRHSRPRRTRPQPARYRRRLRQGPLHRRDRRLGVGQVVIGPRRHRGGSHQAAARVPVGVRAPVGARRPGGPASTRSPGSGPRRVIDASSSIFDASGPGMSPRPCWDAGRGHGRPVQRPRPPHPVVMARAGVRTCLGCGGDNVRRTSPDAGSRVGMRRLCGPGGADRAAPPRGVAGVDLSAVPRARRGARQFDFDRWVVQPDAPICAGCFGGSGVSSAMGPHRWHCSATSARRAPAATPRYARSPSVTDSTLRPRRGRS